MVRGLDTFRDWFEGYHGRHAIIGGTACNLVYARYGAPERATKDIDLVVLADAFDRGYYRRFVEFVLKAGYEHRTRDVSLPHAGEGTARYLACTTSQKRASGLAHGRAGGYDVVHKQQAHARHVVDYLHRATQVLGTLFSAKLALVPARRTGKHVKEGQVHKPLQLAGHELHVVEAATRKGGRGCRHKAERVHVARIVTWRAVHRRPSAGFVKRRCHSRRVDTSQPELKTVLKTGNHLRRGLLES